MKRIFLTAAAVISTCAATVPAMAGGNNLVKNGGFENVSDGADFFINVGPSTLADWTLTSVASPYSGIFFATVYSATGADTTGAPYAGNYYPIYGPGDGYNNGFVDSPNGGNFVSLDGELVYRPELSQMISGLIPNERYQLSFEWGADQYDDSGTRPNSASMTQSIQASLGSQSQTTTSVDLPAHGFAGWFDQTFTFTATSSSESLSFIAIGTPNGLPPVALLDGVSLVEVPEPAAWSLMLLGVAGVGAMARRGRSAKLRLGAQG
jgi:hypothetical protein